MSVLVPLLAVALMACGDATAEPSSSPSPTSQGPLQREPSSEPESTAVPSTPAPPTPTASPSVAAAEWTAPARVAKRPCSSVAALIDEHGDDHVAALCEGGILYATRQPGADWAYDTLKPPSGYAQLAPQVAVAGDRLILAYTQYASEDGACGGSGYLDSGVMIRDRQLPDGAWSDARRLGRKTDRLQAIRVRGDTIHAVVLGPDGWAYERSRDGEVDRYALGDETDSASLRVDDAGRARLLTTWDGHITYGRFTGDGFTWERVPRADNAYDGLLVLDADGAAHAVWTRDSSGRGGCAGTEPDERDGTYYGTNADGSWHIERVSKAVGPASFTLDPATGRVHVVVFGTRLRYFTKPAGGEWSSTRLPVDDAIQPVIRQDPTSGRLLIVYATWSQATDSFGPIYELSKG